MKTLRTAAIAASVLSFGLAPMSRAEAPAGPYLAAMQAAHDSDFAEAAKYFTQALAGDPSDVSLIENAIGSYVGLGAFDRALPLAQRLDGLGTASQVGSIVRVEQLTTAGDWTGLLAAEAKGSIKIAPLVDGLVKGWADVGAGKMQDGLAAFDALAAQPATKAYGLYHKALALTLAGDYEAADKILSGTDNPGLNLTRRGVIAQAEILSQLDRDADAAKLLVTNFGEDMDPGLQQLKTRLDKGETLPVTVVTSVSDGMAEVFYTVGMALNGNTPDAFVLTFSRTAEALQPSHVDALLLSASLLERMGRNDLAIQTYARLLEDSPYYHIAELGRAEALDRQGKTDESIAVLQHLSQTHGDIAAIFVTLGDALRKAERFDEATVAYDRAIALFGPAKEAQWPVYFSRGITEERSKDWPKAEADFRTALKLKPDQPQVLNYLGYSYVEKKQNMDEALDMIQRAVKARPDDGYVTDSLGWVYYRLGKYDQAVVQMEHAVELTPADPTINDHLGDVYWAVGRKCEAEFQWRRALSFKPDEADAVRIRRKLEIGLDAVLKEEGALPLAVAKEG